MAVTIVMFAAVQFIMPNFVPRYLIGPARTAVAVSPGDANRVPAGNGLIHHVRAVIRYLEKNPRLELLYGAPLQPARQPCRRVWAGLKVPRPAESGQRPGRPFSRQRRTG